MGHHTVLITGATSGIGYALAKLFSKHHYTLVLVARNSERLHALSKQLKKEGNQEIYIIKEDLSKKGAAQRVFEATHKLGISIEILINNAGAGYVGRFHEKSLEDDFNIMQLNMGCLTEMTKLFANEMIKYNRGKILNVASTGAYHAGPYTAVYYATKAYVLSLTQALAIELEPYGINVLALCPGATQTAFSKRAGKKDAYSAMSAKEVAERAYKGLMKSKKVIIPGIGNKLFVKLPRTWASPLVGKYQRALMIKK